MRFVAAHDAAQAASDKLPSQAIVVRYLRPDRAAGARVPDAHWHQPEASRPALLSSRPSARSAAVAPEARLANTPLWPCAARSAGLPASPREDCALVCDPWPVSYQLLRSGEGTRALYGVRPQVEKYSGPAVRRRIDELSDSFFNQMPCTMVRADGVTLSW